MVENPNASLPRPLKLGILLAGGCRGIPAIRRALCRKDWFVGLSLDPEQMAQIRHGFESLSSLGLVGFCRTGFTPPLSQGCLSVGAKSPHHGVLRM